jgi:hypothetical protein
MRKVCAAAKNRGVGLFQQHPNQLKLKAIGRAMDLGRTPFAAESRLEARQAAAARRHAAVAQRGGLV